MSADKTTISAEEQLQSRLARECAELDPEEEQTLADEGMATEADQWPPY